MLKTQRMIFTDLDGTLLRSDRTVSEADLATLRRLGEEGILRTIATGRSLYSTKRVLNEDFPIDFLISSTGAGVFHWKSGALLDARSMDSSEISKTTELMLDLDADFAIQAEVPHNHHFHYHATGRENGDFQKRLEIYAHCCQQLVKDKLPTKGTSFLAIEPPYQVARNLNRVEQALPELNVFQVLSPFGSGSRWIEVHPQEVSKGRSASWLAEQQRVERDTIFAIGNDSNDRDLLEWAPHAFVVSNAIAPLRERFQMVSSNDEDGFTQAIRLWEQKN